MYWYLKVLKNYVNFKGRARRKEYWMFTLVTTLISIFISLIELPFNTDISSNIYALVTALPTLAVTTRRLHDIGKSGWWVVLPTVLLIPILLVGMGITESMDFLIGNGVGLTIFFVLCISYGILMLVWTCTDSQAAENKYGKNPKANDPMII
ncbi:DUF805 domain-containing protein [Bacillus sp. OAE603]|uniref:DUF805 domain-containing protein n=1 Tax=Gottfriedia sp. OAE603 TaxID=2663872 RepID=UPI00178A0A8E